MKRKTAGLACETGVGNGLNEKGDGEEQMDNGSAGGNRRFAAHVLVLNGECIVYQGWGDDVVGAPSETKEVASHG